MYNKLRYRRAQHEPRYTPSASLAYIRKFKDQQQRLIDSDPEYRQTNMFETVSDERFLWGGWMGVRDNAGASGIDRESVEYFEAVGAAYKIHKLSHALRDGVHMTIPNKVSRMEKPDGGYRELHIPAVEDRIIMASAAIAMEGLVKARFDALPVHGFIPGRGPHTAIRELMKSNLARKAKFAAHLDVVKFFDHIDRKTLRPRFREYVDDKRAERLVFEWLDTGSMNGKLFVPSMVGIPQGSPFSPTLSNISLEEFDGWACSRDMLEEFGAFYLRYADNLLFLCKRSPDLLIESVKQRLQADSLQVKAQIGGNGWKKVVKPWQFLGFEISKQKDGEYLVRPDAERVRQKVESLKERRKRTEQSISRAVHGVTNYYSIGDIADMEAALNTFPDPVEALEQWHREEVRRRRRAGNTAE